ncbi:SdrD B-like domain-containing protein [Kribbella sp.]|uniref:SdrD B-like domain-containing protein n=1 Tax=Kribbella sp. TaxID=1871183 RepID=UPI002D2A679F|nr:SdrD B-like domain-containing protein [Kribbella sp.]HZX04598.1 SdrD B-like domain-containing protein [Kribbella sp.]
MVSASGAAGAAAAQQDDGTLTVQVLRDFFGTGVINAAMDTPQQGMAVDVTDTAGHHVRGTTDATGKVVVPPSSTLVGGQYRVDVSIPAPYDGYLRAAPASTKDNHFDSFTSFVDVRGGKADSVITAVWNPADYTLPDSKYYVPVQSPAVNADGSAPDPNARALVSFGQDARGTCPDQLACPTVVNTQAQVGTTWGLAYDKYRKRIFQAAFAKRYTEYGPEGGGAIYTTSLDGSSAPTLFAKVTGAALTPHGPGDMRKDPLFTDAPGKESLGGLALSEDGTTLYAVNLRSRRLLSFDATGTDAARPTKTVRIPDPGCAAETDWRPFALTTHDAKLYVGGVCSAESTQQRSDLKAVVYSYDGTTFAPVLTQALTFPRGQVLQAMTQPTADHWNPWDTRLSNWDSRAISPTLYVNPQPELATLAFTRNGSMILGFRDRFMDVIGNGQDPRPLNSTVEAGMSGGDINMACAKPGGGYDWEGTGICPNHGTTANNGHEPAGVVEYFHGDFFDPNRSGNGLHQETSQGSVAYIPQQQFVLSTELDPARDVSSNGVGFYNVDTGDGPGQENPTHGYQFVGPTNSFGKAGGLGDVAYAAANAPIQIGNIVWFDGDHNGIQDPYHEDEVPLAGATVNLLDASGKQVATTRTDPAGEYYFGGVGAEYELTPGAKYTVEFNVCTADTSNVPRQPAATDLRFTLPVAGDDRAHDSNVTPPTKGQLCKGSTEVTAPSTPGGVDHTIDAGVYIPPPVPPTTPTPTPTPMPTASPSPSPSVTPSPTPSATPTATPPGNVPKPPGGPLASTGADVPPLVFILAGVLLAVGGAFLLISRKRRASRQH